MFGKDVIIKEVRDALEDMLQKTEEAVPDQLESATWWTEQIMSALCKWGLKKGLFVCVSDMKDAAGMKELEQQYDGKIDSEWLYDLTCLKYNGDGWLKKIPLVAECELWRPTDIDDDFQKLLLARADVRLMVFNGNHYPTEGKMSDRFPFCKHIHECEHTQTGDTYLFAARLHEDKNGRSVNHRFDYHQFDA